MDLKDQIKEYVSISDVASLYVSLKPAGKNLKGLCPFHSEKTP
ncbi:MAG TPA: CHC2 zinc finger domain-containing protein, partial [Candidatus Aminicenantes bacterium]|nr:CHC2 zinc finger domain-containing protein [Candidatus Aminicenantes bacterium]